MKASFKSDRVRSSWLIPMIPMIIVCLVIAAFSFTALPNGAEVAAAGAQGKEDDAKKKEEEAKKKKKEEEAQKAFDEWQAAEAKIKPAKDALKEAERALAVARAATKDDKEKSDSEKELLENLEKQVAAAQEALKAAEAEARAARVALEKAIAEIPEDSKVKKELIRQRDALSKSGGAGGSHQVVAGNGLRVVNFETDNGRVIVNLPDDMRAGDTISGTVIQEPKGNTEEERNKNRGVLNGYVVEIDGQKFPVNQGSVGPFVIRPLQPPSKPGPGVPPNLDSFFDIFFAVDLSTSPLGPVRIPFQPTHPSGAIVTPDPKITQKIPDAKVANPTPPTRDIITIQGEGFKSQPDDLDMIPGFNIPRLGQQGRPIVIPGPFDGNSSNTGVSWMPVGSTKPPTSFNVIAESPRKTVVTAPTNVAGPLEVNLKEGGKEATGRFRNVGVELTAPKTSLLRGESTELKVRVNGLEGIKETVPLTLECQGVITMTGGNYQPLTIQPSQVGADGSYSTTRGITGVQAGGWGATATVVTRPFNVCLQDDSRAATVILWNTVSGDYSFRPPSGSSAPQTGGAPTIGKGTMVMKGCVLTLSHNAPDRRVFAKLDTCTSAGSAAVEMPASKEKFTITDRNTADNSCAGR